MRSGVGADVGLGIGDGVGVREGLGIAIEVFSPLLHTNFLPVLIHVYLYPPLTFVELILVQDVPAFIAAIDGLTATPQKTRIAIAAERRLLT